MESIRNLIAVSQSLDEEIKELESCIINAPSGNLITRTNSCGTYRYYKKYRLADNKLKEDYLNKNRHTEAVQMAKKLYAQKRVPELRKKKNLIDKEILLREADSPSERFLIEKPGIRQLLQDYTITENDKIQKWKNSPYTKNQKYPDGLIYPTVVPGLKVRSKSEADIISRLEHFGVPYRYEEIIVIDNIEYAMDLTCMNKTTFEIWYWDHRGMMDNPEYIQKTLACDSAFLNAGIIPGINMIITTETKKHPLDMQWVDELIQFFLI